MANGRPADSVVGLFLRLYWIMIGNGLLVVTAALPAAYPGLPAAPLLPVALLLPGVARGLRALISGIG